MSYAYRQIEREFTLFNNGLGNAADWPCRVIATGFFAPDGQILRLARFATCNAETAKNKMAQKILRHCFGVIRKLNRC